MFVVPKKKVNSLVRGPWRYHYTHKSCGLKTYFWGLVTTGKSSLKHRPCNAIFFINSLRNENRLIAVVH